MGELPAFIVGVPEESLDLPREIEDFSLNISNIQVISGAGSGDATETETTTYNIDSRTAFVSKISLDYEFLMDATDKSFDAVVEISYRGIVVFSDSYNFIQPDNGGNSVNVVRGFDLINPVYIQKSDKLSAKVSLLNKNAAANDAQIDVSLEFFGKRQR